MVAERILKKIEIIYNDCSFDKNEINNLGLLILGNSTRNNNRSVENIGMVSEDVIKLSDELFKELNKSYEVNLNSSSFRNRFIIHLNSLLVRCKNGLTSKNNLVLVTKKEFPLVYEMASFLAYQIKEKTGYEINDEEISFLAFHIGSEIDEQLSRKKLVKCALVCFDYNQTDYHLANKISSLFGSKIIITTIINKELDNYKFKNIDLVISTMPIKCDNQYVLIHPLMSQDDISKLDNKISKILVEKENSQIKLNIEDIFSEELFSVDAHYKDEWDAIERMNKILLEKGYVGEDFCKSCFEREKISSTGFGNYAIPHPMIVKGKKTVIFVSLNRKPVKWGESNVNCIFLLCVNEKDKLKFRELFSSIVFILTNKEFTKKIREIKTFTDFMNLINSILKIEVI